MTDRASQNTSEQAPRFLYFDAGNVLLHFDLGVACQRMGDEAGVPSDKVMELVFESDVELRYERGEITTEQFYQYFCEAVGAQPDRAKLLHAASDIFDVNWGIIPLVAQLQAAGYRLGVLSNTNQAHWEWIVSERFSLVKNLFEVFALSYEIGSLKPDEAIYRAAVEMAGESPEDIFFVDDRPENVEAARQYGIDAVQYSTTEVLAAELRQRGALCNY